MLRVFVRACVRAALPVRYTEGFNQRPRISLPLPRPVGLTSDAERMIVELSEDISAERLSSLLTEQMPNGVTIQQAHMLGPADTARPLRSRYRIGLGGFDRDVLTRRASELLRFAPIPYDRYVHKEGRSVRLDLRPYLDSIDVAPDGVYFTIHVTGGGSARPSEVCDLLGFGEEHVNHLIRRLEVVWQ